MQVAMYIFEDMMSYSSTEFMSNIHTYVVVMENVKEHLLIILNLCRYFKYLYLRIHSHYYYTDKAS